MIGHNFVLLTIYLWKKCEILVNITLVIIEAHAFQIVYPHIASYILVPWYVRTWVLVACVKPLIDWVCLSTRSKSRLCAVSKKCML